MLFPPQWACELLLWLLLMIPKPSEHHLKPKETTECKDLSFLEPLTQRSLILLLLGSMMQQLTGPQRQTPESQRLLRRWNRPFQ